MLDENSSTPTADDLPRPPAGRRAARRPAGPPAPVVVPTPVVGAAPVEPEAPATAAPKRTRTRKAAAAVEAPAVQTSVAPEAEDKPARTPRKRTTTRTRKTAAATPVEPEVAEVGQVAEQAEVPVEAVQVPAPESTTAQEPAPAEEPAAEKPARTPRKRAASTRTRTRKAAVAAEEVTAAQADDVVAAEPAVEAAEAELEPVVEAEVAEEAPEGEEPAEVEVLILPELPEGAAIELSPEEAEKALAELTAALVGEVEAHEQDAEAGEADADAESEDDEDDTPRRRRRRRGGRRRRRDPRDEGESTDAEEAGEDDGEVEPAADGEESSESEEVENDAAESGTRRRRRRRRRRGEGTEGDDDPDTEVVVRVREPRSSRRGSASTNDEVTGIEGSTRLEAKRQRRREGRNTRRRAPILSEAEFLARRESVERVMVIRQKQDYTQIGVLEDGVLAEHYVDRASSTTLIGNIYLGRVQNVLPSMEAAFIDIGRGRNAVLYAGEVDWDAFGAEGQARKMENVFKSGQSVLVQVTKDPVGQKGARLTSHLSLPGRYLVYSPGGELSGISRKLADTERARLRDILGHLIDDDASVIVRTAAEGVSEEELVRDVNRLTAQWDAIQKKAKTASVPSQLYAEPDATVRIVRDLFTEDFAKLIVDGHGGPDDAWETLDAYVTHVAPHLAGRLQKWDREEQGDLFARYRIDEQIAKALERKVFLPSGGSLVIDRTEAMTVIDVNTGKFTGTGGNLEATVTSNNLEAAEEIVRQLRLRDIGGIIVIDFIDMVLPSNRELLLRRLVECLGRDRTRHQVAEVTSLGLVQMTRKKIGTGLAEAFTVECEVCKGRGYHRHSDPVESQAPADGGDRSERKAANRRGGRKSTRRSGKSDDAPASE